MEVQLNSFHLSGHTLEFHPQTKTLETHYVAQDLTLSKGNG